MKDHVLISILFLATLTYGQDWRLDSVATDFGKDHVRTKYIYTSSRDFVVRQDHFKDQELKDSYVTTYQDSLPVKSVFTIPPMNIDWTLYEYDAKQRLIASTTKSWLPGVLYKYYTYWQDTDLKTSEITVEITGSDTSSYFIKQKTYDPDDRLTGGMDKIFHSGFLERSDEWTRTYKGDSVEVTTGYSFDNKSGYDTVTTEIITHESFLHDTTRKETWTISMMPNGTPKDTTHRILYKWGDPRIKENNGTISSFQGKVRGGLFQFESFADSYTSYQYSCTYEGDLNHGLDEALSHLNLVGKSTCKVNEFGLPTLMVTNYNFTPTERRTQNFYKLFKPGSGNTAEMTNLSDCRVIHELHPECRYFDLSGHQVSGRMGLTQYLIEKGPTGTNRVLFIEE